MENCAARLYERRWGVFNHFLFTDPGISGVENKLDDMTALAASAKEWNRRVNALQPKEIARIMHELGAGWYGITIMQGRRWMLAPNAAYNDITGAKPGEACAERDVIAELADALAAYDIDLMLYFTGDGPHLDPEYGPRFGFTAPRQNVPFEFIDRWASVLQEYSVRYGDKVKYWWVDGCYDYFGYDTPRLARYYDAIRAGSQNSAASFNNGTIHPLERWYPEQEFTCGEFVDFTFIPDGRWYDHSGRAVSGPEEGAQAHILAPMGLTPAGKPGGWRQKGCVRDHAYMKEYAARLHEIGCGLTVDIHVGPCGEYEEDQLNVIAGI